MQSKKLERYLPNFKEKLKEIDFETLEKDPHSIYAVDEDFRLIYFNEAYIRFAEENNGEPHISNNFLLGTSILDAITGDIKELYVQALKDVLHSRKSITISYECSSVEKFRVFMQKLYPLKDGKGVVILNSLQVEKEIEDNNDFLNDNYLQDTGFINQCSNCRSTQSATDLNRWDWLPDYITKIPKNMSHTICPICFDYYWKNR